MEACIKDAFIFCRFAIEEERVCSCPMEAFTKQVFEVEE
jgi:hypothetical protein